MKTITGKILLALLSLIVFLIIGCNFYMFFITYKLSECKGIFDSISIVSKYKLFENIGVGAISLSITIVLLFVLLVSLINKILKK
jgi:hypothetical protein